MKKIVTVQERFMPMEAIDEMFQLLMLKTKAQFEFHVFSKTVEHRQMRGEYIHLHPLRLIRCPVRKMQVMRPVVSRLIGDCVFVDAQKYEEIKDTTIRQYLRYKNDKPKATDGLLYLPVAAAGIYAHIWATYKETPTRTLDFYDFLRTEFKKG